jgi:hypothetical protein
MGFRQPAEANRTGEFLTQNNGEKPRAPLPVRPGIQISWIGLNFSPQRSFL